MSIASSLPVATQGDPEIDFYRDVMQALARAGVPVLVGGAYALSIYTGIERRTKDLDLFLRRSDYERAAHALDAAGFATDLKFPHWLGKAMSGSWCVDLIFNSGNGLTRVDDAWFEHAIDAEVLDLPAQLVPVEEIIWSKALIMERERYDGGDVAHLLRARGAALDWRRLMQRMEPQWRVLLSHLVLFGFIYPAERDLVPRWVMEDLVERLRAEVAAPAPHGRVCHGTLLSREQYLHDVQQDGYADGRLPPSGTMSAEHLAIWTRAIDEDGSQPAG